jgi:peptidoglycan/LPS O-acetylase OafA/YrhL
VQFSRNNETRVTSRQEQEFNIAAHGLRGVASLMVFFAHLLGGVGKHVYNEHPQYQDYIQSAWNFGVFGVELFFIISGFVILPSVMRYSPQNFAIRRFVRIYPLFFVLSAVFVILNMLTLRRPELNDPLSVVSGLLFLNLFTGTEQLTPNAWTLTFEVMFYSLICFLWYAMNRGNNSLLKAIAVLACLAFIGFFPIALYFAMGVIVRLLHDNNQLTKGNTAKIFEVLLALSCIHLASGPHIEYTWAVMKNPIVPLTMVTTGLYFYFAVSPDSVTRALMNNRIISYFGVVSYSLYLVHPYVYLVCRMIFVKYGVFTEDVLASMVMFFVITTLLTVPITHVFHVLFERMPYQFIFRRRVYNVTSEAVLEK